ncbi:MAG: S-methyl-5-thioribose-1-phosphate isomerase [Lewinellaceae bacterium]|nr:S-methyl-5-thioribose-1-phosphate isomerase [Lewinellaceae bacterium]
MRLEGKHYRTIWLDESDAGTVHTIDQRSLPFQLDILGLHTLEDTAQAIEEMVVRGAPLIGVTAAWGFYLALLTAETGTNLTDLVHQTGERLARTRPTAVDLFYAIRRQQMALQQATTYAEAIAIARQTAEAMADESAEQCRQIGLHGLPLLEAIAAQKPGEPVNILTHCNAGWLACIDYGTATAPIYAAHDRGIPVHVWVDETRPRNQGGKLTAYELGQHGVPHTIITDNAGGHLMQHGKVDLVIVGTDRTTRQGDVANKIGTYLKALAAHDNGIPFYVGLPSSSLDVSLANGLQDIPIEVRSEEEIHQVWGWNGHHLISVRTTPRDSPAANYGFDVTPGRLVSGLITERGICPASEAGIRHLFSEKFTNQ